MMNFTRSSLLVLVVCGSLLSGCGRDKSPSDVSGPSEIRIFNSSIYVFEALQVGDEYFGQVESMARTEYRTYPIAYRYNYVRVVIQGIEVVLAPIDYVGEQPLGLGHFTYHITAEESGGTFRVGIFAERDA